MIKIIHRGEVPSPKRKFTCTFCNTVYVAEIGDYSTMVKTVPGLAFGETSAICYCPVCHKPCYNSVPYRDDSGLSTAYAMDNNKQWLVPPYSELALEVTEGAE